MIDPAFPQERKHEGGPRYGQMWSIPYSLTPPRDDADKTNQKITIIDAIFNSSTYEKAQKEPSFNALLESTALDSIENDLKLKIDKKRVKRMKQPYKGTPHPAVVRKRTTQKDPKPIGPLDIPYPPLKEEMTHNNTTKKEKRQQTTSSRKNENNKKHQKNEPKYSIVHRGELDYQDFTNERTSNAIKRPKELIVTIELPGLETSAKLEVDIFEKSIKLHHVEPSYHLELALSYPVDEDKSVAKFNKTNSTLILTLPVIPLQAPPITTPTNEPALTCDSNGINEQLINELNDDKATPTSSPANGSSKNALNGEEIISDWSINEGWKCPSFSFTQEKDVISYILRVANIKESTVIQHCDISTFHITFKGTDENCYSFYVSFPPGECVIIDSQTSVSKDNLVVVLRKQVKSCDDGDGDGDMWWPSFDVGVNPNNTQRKLFHTEENMTDILHEIESEDIWKPEGECVCPSVVEVVTADDKEAVVFVSNNTESTAFDKNENDKCQDDKEPDGVSNTCNSQMANGKDNEIKSEDKTTTTNGGLHLSNSLMFDLD
jgi:dynein assembly factor 2